MISPEDHDRLQAYLDGDLPAEATAQLETQLKQDSGLVDALLILAREEAIIGEWARVANRTKLIESKLIPAQGPSNGLRSWIPLAVAASLMLSAGVFYWRHRPAPPSAPAVAVLERAVGRVSLFSGDLRISAVAGASIIAGQGLEVQGEESSALVVYPDGTRLEIDGDAVVSQFVDEGQTGKRVLLAEGNLRAEVAKQPLGRPMVLKTTNAEVVVLGTKFDLSGSTQATHVETAEGAVRLIRSSDGRSIEVPAGFEGRADAEPAMDALPSPPRYRQSRFATPGCHRTTLLSPDGLTLVTTRFGTGKVTFWNVLDLSEQMTWQAHTAQIEATAFASDGTTFATGGMDRTIKLWHSTTGSLKQTIPAPEHLQAIALADEGKIVLALAGIPQRGMQLHAWDLAANQPRGEPRAIRGEAWAFSASGRLLAISSAQDLSVTVWDTIANREKAVFRRWAGGRVYTLAFSPDESRLAVSDWSGRVVVRDLNDLQREKVFFPPGGSVQGLSFSHDGEHLAMGQRYATVRVADLESGRQLFVLEGERRQGSTASVRPMFFTPDGRTLAATQSLDDSIVRLWDLPVP